MDPRVMELRIKQWIPIIEEQAKSGISKGEWCAMHGIERTTFFRWQKRVRAYLLDQWQDHSSQLPSSTQTEEISFVEIPSAQVTLMEMPGQADPCTGNKAACSSPPSICIRYGGFSIDLGSGVNEEQLSTVLRIIKHAE